MCLGRISHKVSFSQPPIQVLNEMVGAGNVLSNTLPPSKDGYRMTTVEINVEVSELCDRFA